MKKTWKITRGIIETFPRCNHVEAYMRLILHAAMSKSPAVIVAKDTDVFLLLAYAVCYQNNPPRWYMKIDANQFINMIMIHDSVWKGRLQYSSTVTRYTDSDTAAYKFNIGKVRVLKKVIKDPSGTLLFSKLGTTVLLSDDDIEKAMQYIQTVMYGGKIHESYVSTRVRLYKNLKTKSSVSYPQIHTRLRINQACTPTIIYLVQLS